jgi:large subunit ribosomal protein L10
MNRTDKAQLAQELKEKFSKAKVAIFADYKGLSATDADSLRRALRSTDTEVKVLKNNVARLLTKEGSMGSQAKDVMDGLVGPTLVAFGYKDPAATAKVIDQFASTNEALRLKDSLLGASKLDVAGVKELANLPGREVLLAKVLGTLNAPAQSFVGVLAAVPRSLVTVLAAIEKKKAGSQS